MKYFKERAELELSGEILPYGVEFHNVQSSFLDGLINHYRHIKAYCLCYSCNWGDPLNGGEGARIAIREQADLTKVRGERDPSSYSWPASLWPQFAFYLKGDLFDALTLPKATYNLHLSAFYDDVIILAQSYKDPEEYVMFWYAYDGHCVICRFKTGDPIEVVTEEFTNYSLSEQEGCDAPREIPLHAFDGWISA